jgi:hypothetical protein
MPAAKNAVLKKYEDTPQKTATASKPKTATRKQAAPRSCWAVEPGVNP